MLARTTKEPPSFHFSNRFDFPNRPHPKGGNMLTQRASVQVLLRYTECIHEPTSTLKSLCSE
jgi:hypothetical protein